MPTNAERQMASVIDQLSIMQIVALELGTVHLAHYFVAAQMNDPHPIKHNLKARVHVAGIYQNLLRDELCYHLPDRDPEKARRIAEEMALSDVASVRDTAKCIQDRLEKKPEKPSVS